MRKVLKTTIDIFPMLIGYVLICPAVISVFWLLSDLMSNDQKFIFDNLNRAWTGEYYSDGGQFPGLSASKGSGGYTSALPFYFGLMGIAGAYLIRNNSKKENH